MKHKRRGEKVNKRMKTYGALSVLERGIYSKTSKSIPKLTDCSVMEMKIYNSTRSGGRRLWQRIRGVLGKTTEEDF